MRRQIGGVAVLVAVLAVTAVASGARLKTKSESTAVGPFPDTGTVTAKCKKGQKVVSGGFAGEVEGDDVAVVPYSTELDGARKWSVSAINGTDFDGTLTSHAYCREGKRLKTESATVTVPEEGPSAAGTATAKCAKGQKAVSGGFDVVPGGPNPQTFPVASHRDGKREWTVSAVSYDSQPSTLTAFAYCQETTARLKAKTASTTIGPFFEVGVATAKCKRGQRVVSGGFDNPDVGPDIDTDPQILPFVSMRLSKRKWTASAYNEGPASGTFTVYAYCEKKG